MLFDVRSDENSDYNLTTCMQGLYVKVRYAMYMGCGTLGMVDGWVFREHAGWDENSAATDGMAGCFVPKCGTSMRCLHELGDDTKYCISAKSEHM